ncbi:MAG: VCBS repeat-containing protein [bacterium]|nr:VCBS repeat-containing protein [bacterium]
MHSACVGRHVIRHARILGGLRQRRPPRPVPDQLHGREQTLPQRWPRCRLLVLHAGGAGRACLPGQSIACAWLDIDHDGNLEVYVSNRDGSNQLLRILPQIEDITPPDLQYATATQGFAWGDVDLDMDPDLYIVGEGVEHAFLEQQSDNRFLPIGVPSPIGGQGASLGDFDNDGDLDIYVTHWGPGNRLLRNDGQGNFLPVASPVLENTAWGQAAVWGDYDNDGYLDLYLANYATANVLLHNEGGTGTFTAAPDSVLGGDGASIGAAWSGIDDDGDLDLYVCNNGQPDVLARNNLDDVGNWLKVRLHGYRGQNWPCRTSAR